MKFEVEMVQARLADLAAAMIREVRPVEPVRIARAPVAGAAHLDDADVGWGVVRVGERWSSEGQTCWLRADLRIPDAWAGQRVALHVELGNYQGITEPEGQAYLADINYYSRPLLTGPEALAYLDGQPVQGIDYFHRHLLLGNRVEGGAQHVVALEAFSSLVPGPQVLGAFELVRLDAQAEAIYYDMRVLLEAVQTMPEDALPRIRLTRALVQAYDSLDLRRPESAAYLDTIAAAREILRRAVERGDGGEDQPRIVAVGHAHIDLAWQWPVSQTRRKGARTFSTVLKLMEQYPAYHFVASQPALYQMVREDEPELYARILRRIREGRFEPTGASWVEMDCNLAGGEALVRQFLVGKRFFREELGVDPKVLWLPDVFGYTAALPQILKGCDVDYFMTTKISWNEYNRLPYDTFRWRGIDGTEVLTHMVTAPIDPRELMNFGMQPFYTYNAKFSPFDVVGDWRAYRQKAINEELLYLFGHGDGGGGPTAQMQEVASRLARLPGFPRVEQSSAEAFFRRLEERVEHDPELPTWVGELYLEYHRGTYTSQAWIKRANRRAELLYREAELWAASAGMHGEGGAERMMQQVRTLAPGWETMLFNQFHDILPGSSIGQVYADARRDYAAISARGEQVRDTAQRDLVRELAAGGPELAIFNPAPFARTDPVECVLDSGTPLSADGSEPVDAQELEPGAGAHGSRRVLLAASAPPLGMRLLRCAERAERLRAASGGLTVTPRVLENRYFRLELDERAEIVSLYDKRAEREVIAPDERGNHFVAFEDRPLNFDAWDINLYYQDKPYPIDDLTSCEVVETGPLRGGVEIIRRYGASTIRQRVLLYRDVPRIDFPTWIDWHEHQTLLKVAFPVTVNSPTATFDIQWGNVERPTHWNTSWDWARFETCAHKWVDLSEGDYGVSLLNDCKYGHDIKGHTLRLTLVKSGIHPDPEADQGEHVFAYALLPHQGDWRTGETVRHAYLFNMPASAWATRGGEPEAPGEQQAQRPAARDRSVSVVQTDRPGLVIETVKPAENGDGIVVRYYDAHNTHGVATLRFARPVVAAVETNMLEEPLGPATWHGHEVDVAVRPYGIGTLRVQLER